MSDFPKDMTVYRAFTDAASRHAHRPFLRAPAVATKAYAAGAIEYAYASAREAVDTLAGGYAVAGVGQGHRIAVAYDSRLDVYIHLLALNALGASLVPLNMAGSDEEVSYVIVHRDA